jgi:hypothetical protein
MEGMTSNSVPRPDAQRLSVGKKVLLLWRVWWMAGRVQLALRTGQLPEITLSMGEARPGQPFPPALLSRAVSRGLRVGRWRPRCLIRSLVLYRLLREQGEPAELVIGLTEFANSPDAHAWVELRGRDLGPWPGRGSHVELARYPRSS